MFLDESEIYGILTHSGITFFVNQQFIFYGYTNDNVQSDNLIVYEIWPDENDNVFEKQAVSTRHRLDVKVLSTDIATGRKISNEVIKQLFDNSNWTTIEYVTHLDSPYLYDDRLDMHQYTNRFEVWKRN